MGTIMDRIYWQLAPPGSPETVCVCVSKLKEFGQVGINVMGCF